MFLNSISYPFLLLQADMSNAMTFKLDTGKNKQWAIFKPYEWALLHFMIETPNTPLSSSDCHEYLTQIQTLKISRASVIFTLQDWSKIGLIESISASGKGGVRSDYVMTKTKEECYRFIAQLFLDKITEALEGVIIAQLKKSD